MARRRRPDEPAAAPTDPPDWIWRFRFADWAHVEFEPTPVDDDPLMAFGVHYAGGAPFWRYCRARDHWREQARAWLRDNDRYLWPHWPMDRIDFKRVGAEESWKVLPTCREF